MPKSPQTLLDKFDPLLLLELAFRIRSSKDVAVEFGITETHLSRVLKAQGFRRLPGPVRKQRLANAALTEARTEYREGLAMKVQAGQMTLPAACKKAKCHERTMFRYIAKLPTTVTAATTGKE